MQRLLIIAIVLLFSCKRPEITRDEQVAIYGLWVAGQTPEINAWMLEKNSVTPAQNQRFELLFPDGEKAFFMEEDGLYRLQSSRIPQPGEKLTMYWLLDQDTAIATVDLPPAPQVLTQPEDTLDVSLDESVFVEWNVPSGSYECALQLECLETVQIPSGPTPGNFSLLYNGPRVESELNIEGTAFSFLGRHRLTISVLNAALLDAFFYDPSDIRGLIKNGPDNVVGGKGFIGGSSRAEVFIYVE